MIIKAIFDRIENGFAVLLPDNLGIEINIPVSKWKNNCQRGESVSIMIYDNGALRLIG
ncbi:hypothetical protein RBH29_02310 [Herbivorax sp. ANBcel31]|uniref:hypothetical protein n=1 Tax=Herbivorax sp. ANBcel31 TaxID=3069754 RepID=UPI0027B0D420|nr:hypothetical protein [Herbivorax sp. ANBcel31]MDQ2085269.1 hypothetical protein [Herbivorax sp. ANBcel31]